VPEAAPQPVNWFRRIGFLLSITQSHGIARRYFVVNGFDGALAMLGVLVGFYVSGGAQPELVVSACLGAAIALGASGVSSAYLSEAAERRKALRELEAAMISPLDESAHGEAARLVPFAVALVNGLSPLLVSMVIIAPLWLAAGAPAGGGEPLLVAIATAFGVIFLLGAFLGRVSRAQWLWTGLRAVLIAAATSAVIVLVR
jgi:predicted membrane protein (TIGR00267 family)